MDTIHEGELAGEAGGALAGTQALVTGGGSGLGRAIALDLARSGADVVVHYHRSKAGADETVRDIAALGRRADALGGDLRDGREAQELVDAAVAALGGSLDVLVNNAGHLVGRRRVAEMAEDHWHQVIDVNLTSMYLVCRAALPALVASGAGRIVNMSSVSAYTGGGGGTAAYAAAKAGVLGFTRALAKELAADGIRVNAVAPGLIGQTAFHDRFTSDEARRRTAMSVPLGREGTPQDVAAAVTFLASPAASYITGETIEISGGLLSH